MFQSLNLHVLVTHDDDAFFLGKEGKRNATYVDLAVGIIGGRICGEGLVAKVSLVYVLEASFMTLFLFYLSKSTKFFYKRQLFARFIFVR